MSRMRRAGLVGCLILPGVWLSAQAQANAAPFPAPAPTTAATVGAWDAAIVLRAATFIATPGQWNHADTRTCAAKAETFSIACALQRAVEEAAGIHRDRGPRVAGTDASPPTQCALHRAAAAREGSCGQLFDEVPIFSLARATAITSGIWQRDRTPTEVWAGTMADAESPVANEADETVGVLSRRKYDEPLVGYNNDSTTTFADVQAFFRMLCDRVTARATTDLGESTDQVEIEVYAGGTGVIRTYTGWFAVTGFTATDSTLRFRIDTVKQIPPSALDREILVRAATIITSDAVWNRADNRKCPATATKWSIYCAVVRAEVEVAGGFHHRRPAMELVREIVDERTAKKAYNHRLMDYNNDPTTHLDDAASLFREAIARINQ